MSDTHNLNLDAAQRKIDARTLQGEDMSRAYVDPTTFEIKFKLPPMRNVGVLTLSALKGIVGQFPDKEIVLTKSDLVWSVRSRKGVEMLSAVAVASNHWHVRAIEGLITLRVV